MPDTTITSGPADGAIVLDRKLTFTYTSDAPSGADVTYQCTMDDHFRFCGDGSVTLKPTRRTHLFTVAAIVDGVVDPTPATRSFTLPLNDKQLKRPNTGFSRSTKSDGSYLGSYREAREKGALLKRSVSGALGLALVVSRSKKDGAVKVKLDGTLIKKVNLKGPRGAKKVIRVSPTRPGPLTGALTIQTANKKRVRIEGLAVITEPPGVATRVQARRPGSQS